MDSAIQMSKVLKNISIIAPLNNNIPLPNNSSSQINHPSIQRQENLANTEKYSSTNSNYQQNIFKMKLAKVSGGNRKSMVQTQTKENYKTIPSSWSNIAQLIGDSNSAKSESIQRKEKYCGDNEQEKENWTVQKSAFLPPGTWKSNQGITNLDLMGQPQQLKTKIQKNLETKTQLKEATSKVTAKAIPPIKQNEVKGHGDPKIAQLIIKELTSEAQSNQTNNSQNIEILAREIYGLVKQRIEIDRERQGNFYNRFF